MEITVEPGKTYAVTTSGSCTVTDADGLKLCTATSGSQAFFVATTPTVKTSDNNAKVSRANFNCALAGRGAGGGSTAGGNVPEGCMAIDYLQFRNEQSISLGVSNLTSARIDVEPSAKPSRVPLLRWPPSSSARGYLALFSDSEIGIIFGNNLREYVYKTPTNQRNTYELDFVKTVVRVNKETLYQDRSFIAGASQLIPVELAKASYKLYSFEGTSAERNFKLKPVINANGIPSLVDTETGQVYEGSQSGFNAGLSGITALANVLLHLPLHDVAGSSLRVNLPDGYDEDKVEELCNLAGTLKNWQIIVV